MTTNLLPEQIANILRRGILQGEFKPGHPIKERDQAKAMQVSRTPMREAVRILAQEGLVTLRAARSPIVADPSFEEICDVIEVLTTLELRCGVLACTHALQSDLDHITQLNESMQQQRGTIAKVELFELDMAFHMAIAHASHNPVLAQTHTAFLRRLWRARFLSVYHMGDNDIGQKQHDKMVEALIGRDTKALQRELSEHLGNITQNIRDQYTSEAS